jgi:hypothetical protein
MKTLLAAVLLVCSSGSSFGAILTQVFPSPAPNAFGSPSWNPGYVQNALNALENGLSSVGNPATTPTAYYQVTTEGDRDNIVTGFPSWKGFVNPGAMFGAAFANELGNRLHFGVHILGNGTQFSLSELSFDMESTDAGDIFQFVGDFSTPSDVYSSTRVGINYGPDHIKGTADDVRISSGPATQVVDELVYVGVGNALAGGDVSCPGSNQATMDCVKAFYDSISPFNITTTYTLRNANGGLLSTGSATVLFPAAVPEPATWGFMIVGLAGIKLMWGRMASCRRR